MSGIIRVSEAATIALHACAWMARQAGATCRSRDVCAALGFSAAHFAKVMQALSRAGLVRSVRGPTGGTQLARPAADIRLVDIYEAVDGPARTPRCLLAPHVCPASCCTLGRQLAAHETALHKLLSRTSLAELAATLDAPAFKPTRKGRR